MRLRDNRGAIKTIVEALPVIEARREFNGEGRRDIGICKSASVKPNGLYFTFDKADSSSGGLGIMSDSTLGMFVGNLKPEVVENILNDLAEKGVADISSLPYQENKLIEEEYILDNGKSAAYCTYHHDPFSCGFVVPNSYRINAMNASSDEEDECSREDLSVLSDEGLRLTIYGLGDYTFKELAAMSREELEEEYDNLEVNE